MKIPVRIVMSAVLTRLISAQAPRDDAGNGEFVPVPLLAELRPPRRTSSPGLATATRTPRDVTLTGTGHRMISTANPLPDPNVLVIVADDTMLIALGHPAGGTGP